MKIISNKAIVSTVGILSILGAIAFTGVADCLWAILLLIPLVDMVKDYENN